MSDSSDVVRRRLLKAVAAGGTGFVASLAGCSVLDAQLAGDQTDSRTEAETDEPDEHPDALTDEHVDLVALRETLATIITEDAYRYVLLRTTSDGAGDVEEGIGIEVRANADQRRGIEVEGWTSGERVGESPADADHVYVDYFDDDESFRHLDSEEQESWDRNFDQFTSRVLNSNLDGVVERLEETTFDSPHWDVERGVYVVPVVGFDDEFSEAGVEDGELHVRPDGVPVRLAGRLTYDTFDVDVEITFDDAERTVEEPEWVDDVRATVDQTEWTVTVDGDPSMRVDGDAVYVGDDSGVYALDPADGSERWRVDLDDGLSSLAVADETVFATESKITVYALDAADGGERWVGHVPERDPTPIVAGDTVVFSGDGLHGFDAVGGTYEWVFDDEQVTSAMVDGDLYVGGVEGTVRALDVDDGTEKWSYSTETDARVTPLVAGDDALYLRGPEEQACAVDLDDGEPLWRRRTDGTVRDVIVEAGVAYVASENGSIRALDATTGAERWLVVEDGDVRGLQLDDSGTLYARTWKGRVVSLSAASGDVNWSFETGDLIGPLVLDGDDIYFGSRDASLYLLDANTGRKRWDYEFEFWVRRDLFVVDDVVYAADPGERDGNVYQIKPEY